jgi:hypothetical protein
MELKSDRRAKKQLLRAHHNQKTEVRGQRTEAGKDGSGIWDSGFWIDERNFIDFIFGLSDAANGS